MITSRAVSTRSGNGSRRSARRTFRCWWVLMRASYRGSPATVRSDPGPRISYTVENSVYVAPEQRGRGIGTAILGPLIEIARSRGFHAMVAGIDATNAASLKLHAKFGFEEVAHFRQVGWKFERWLDLVFLQRIF